MRDRALVIIGSGIAGYALAREFRKLDKTSRVFMITADDGAMYSKRMLSNASAQGKVPDALVQKDAARAAQDLGIEVLTTRRVTGIDRGAMQVLLNDGQCLAYSKLVLALGARPRPYPLGEGDASLIETVNSLDDYRRWRDGIGAGSKILIMAAGLIGAEFANDLAAAQCRITVVDPMPWPLGRLLPEQAGHELRKALEAIGVNFHLQRSVTQLGLADGTRYATLDDGTRLNFDRALSAIGLIPQTELAGDAGLAVATGIRVNALLATSDADIFALGDCAQTDAGVLPYVLPVIAQARALAQTLAGTPTPLLLAAMPVVVKTPVLPIAICPPRPGAEGSWHVSGDGCDLRAVFRSLDGTDLGFALTCTLAGSRQALAKQMPALLAA